MFFDGASYVSASKHLASLGHPACLWTVRHSIIHQLTLLYMFHIRGTAAISSKYRFGSAVDSLLQPPRKRQHRVVPSVVGLKSKCKVWYLVLCLSVSSGRASERMHTLSDSTCPINQQTRSGTWEGKKGTHWSLTENRILGLLFLGKVCHVHITLMGQESLSRESPGSGDGYHLRRLLPNH
jgi:hypothetical protein